MPLNAVLCEKKRVDIFFWGKFFIAFFPNVKKQKKRLGKK